MNVFIALKGTQFLNFIFFLTIVSSKIGVCESIITYEQKASIPLIAMMYILHRQLNGKFLPLADF